jgi:hypothetical protein
MGNPMPKSTLTYARVDFIPQSGLSLGTYMMRQVPTTLEESPSKMREFVTGTEYKNMCPSSLQESYRHLQ